MISRYEQFVSSVSGIYRHIQKIERMEMEKLGYRGVYAQYLAAMNRYPDGVTSVELSEICDKDKAAISRVVAEMEVKGLVVKEGAAYRARLRLTDEGRRAAEYVNRRAETAVAAVGRDLTPERRGLVYEALNAIAENLETVCREGIPESEEGA